MLFNSPLEVPSGDSPERSSAGIRGPSQVPADDDDVDLDVADATIIGLEDGFTFQRVTAPRDLAEQYEVFGHDVSRDHLFDEPTLSFLVSNWLVGQGES
jgi:hypothetical protein